MTVENYVSLVVTKTAKGQRNLQLGSQNKPALEKWIATEIRGQVGLRRDFYNQDMTYENWRKIRESEDTLFKEFPH